MLTVSEAADQLKVTRNTVYDWVSSGALPAVRVGKKILIREADLEGEPVAKPLPALMTTGEVSAAMRCSRRAVSDMLATGELEGMRLTANGHYRITRASVEKKLGVTL